MITVFGRVFDKDDPFFNEHKKFMEELIETGYASMQVNVTAKDQVAKLGMFHFRMC